jgi:hypothetical protein
MVRAGLIGCAVPCVFAAWQFVSDGLPNPTLVMLTWPTAILMIGSDYQPLGTFALRFSMSAASNGVVYAFAVWFVVRAFNRW